MAYDLEEQEQLASIQAWWARYGNLCSWLLIAALTVYAGWAGWKYYQRNQSAQAGQLYEELQKAVTQKDATRVQRAASDMEERFSHTAYAEMTGLTAAKVAVDGGDPKSAKAQLQWVIDHAADDEYKAIAKVRLAGVLLDEKAYDEGLKLLAGDFPAAFAGLVADRKGDLLTAQNKLAEARSAYQTALSKMDQKDPGRQLVQLKLDALGGANLKVGALGIGAGAGSKAAA